jgi:hypothetical protein
MVVPGQCGAAAVFDYISYNNNTSKLPLTASPSLIPHKATQEKYSKYKLLMLME